VPLSGTPTVPVAGEPEAVMEADWEEVLVLMEEDWALINGNVSFAFGYQMMKGGL